MALLDRMTYDPAAIGGSPCIRGMPVNESSEVFGRRTACARAWRVIWLGAHALLATACGTDERSPTAMAATPEPETTTDAVESAPGTPSPSDVVASESLDIIVPPGEGGALPPDLWVACKLSPRFQVSDLEEIVPLADGDPDIAEAIEPFLTGGEGQYWPQTDWLILRETEREVLLVHREAESLSFMNVSRVDETWTWSGAQQGGPCPLHYVVPDGFNTVEWRLDPESPPDADSTTLSVLVSERECASGEEVGDRLRGPQIVMTDDVIRMAFAAVPPPGDVSCQANPETSVTVQLPASLGDREIIEGLAIGIDLEDYLTGASSGR